MLKFISKNFTRHDRIKDILTKKYNPTYLDLINESNKHNVADGSETHFKVTIVSEDFTNKNTVNIHREIYILLKDEMGEKRDNKLHALSINAKTPKDWNNSVTETPDCVFKKI
jgi:stress-induced morphogen